MKPLRLREQAKSDADEAAGDEEDEGAAGEEGEVSEVIR